MLHELVWWGALEGSARGDLGAGVGFVGFIVCSESPRLEKDLRAEVGVALCIECCKMSRLEGGRVDGSVGEATRCGVGAGGLISSAGGGGWSSAVGASWYR